uniref:Uncharacterized protein n=1 Tax=Anguilla anguilla TaxID=7936 RepID=A0A0E9W417_ANGAN
MIPLQGVFPTYTVRSISKTRHFNIYSAPLLIVRCSITENMLLQVLLLSE